LSCDGHTTGKLMKISGLIRGTHAFSRLSFVEQADLVIGELRRSIRRPGRSDAAADAEHWRDISVSPDAAKPFSFDPRMWKRRP
jgi:hypothetical protein